MTPDSLSTMTQFATTSFVKLLRESSLRYESAPPLSHSEKSLARFFDSSLAPANFVRYRQVRNFVNTTRFSHDSLVATSLLICDENTLR